MEHALHFRAAFGERQRIASMNVKEMALVAFGGALGCVARHWVNSQFHSRFTNTFFPWNTLTVNVTGCLLIGLVIQASEAEWISPPVRLLLVTGILGGLTTFSTFAHDTWQCWNVYGVRWALLNLSANLIFGLGAAWLGVAVGRWAFATRA